MASRLTVFCARSSISAILLLATSALVQAHGSEAAKQAWTQARTSLGLHRLQHDVVTIYQAPTRTPPGAVISQVYARREYAGQADVQTSVCWRTLEHCVEITGRSVTTHDFEGMSADGPILLVHRAKAWRGSHTPLHVKGSVTVWYETQPARPN